MGYLTPTECEIIALSEKEEKQNHESQHKRSMTDYLHVVVHLGSLLLLICKSGDCYRIRCFGELKVDQEVIAMGSNLTVHCQSDTNRCGSLFVIELDKQEVVRETSCSTVTAQLIVSRPKSWLHCKVQLNGKFHTVCGRDINVELIPSTPLIKEIVFAKDTLYPSIHWQTSDNMELLNSDLRFRITHGVSDWMKGNVTQLHQGNLLMLENLEPLTSYEFKLRVCTTTLRLNCSLWSQPVNKTSPRKEDHDGELQYYELIYQQNGSTHTLNFSVLETQCSLQLPLEVTGLNVSAVTSAGSSPPASVSLIYTDVDDLPKSILHQEMSISRLASAGHKGHKGKATTGHRGKAAPARVIRKVCMSMGPSWLFEHLPKLGDSNAIKLLKDESCGSDLCWQQVDSDPPLSPVEDFNPPVERKDSYPTAHTENPLEEMKAVQDWAVCPYKPQLAVVSQRLVAVSEAVEKEEDEHAWVSSSPTFTQFEEVFFPSQGMHRPLNSCLTVDGAPISVDVDGLLFLSQISIQENMWRVQRDATLADNVNGDQNTDQGQAALPNDLMRCERASLNTRCLSPQGVKTVLKSSDEQFE
ncbi:hypothetical protein P4O66_009712 [Electrophorus voltai]|uniref:Fibronectin type-III domain-containing protein n=1 Tax=Electrophorus voltai TaxID=2609070 RepID=A0AAD8ZC91_9TELE|nr:hypothetical protein P4O66_009712 [Electrophorus voltai]